MMTPDMVDAVMESAEAMFDAAFRERLAAYKLSIGFLHWSAAEKDQWLFEIAQEYVTWKRVELLTIERSLFGTPGDEPPALPMRAH